MNGLMFYESMEMLTTANECAKFLEMTTYDVASYVDPDILLTTMFDITSYEEGLIVAKAFKKRFGDIAICRFTSKLYWRPITIMDTIEISEFQKYININALQYVREAFIQMGFKRSHECDIDLLRTLYCLDSNYHNDKLNKEVYFIFPYNYDSIKKRNSNLNKDLIEYIMHPTRILKWINQNPNTDIEAYLN